MQNVCRLAYRASVNNLSFVTTRRLYSIQSTPWIYSNPERPPASSSTPANTTCTRSVCQTRKQRNLPKTATAAPNPTQDVQPISVKPPSEEKPPIRVKPNDENQPQQPSSAPSRPPDRWLYKHMLLTSRRWWTDLINRSFVSPSSKSPSNPPPKSSRPPTLDEAKKQAGVDLDEMQKSFDNIVKTIQTKSEPALVIAGKVFDTVRTNAQQVILKLEKTAPGQKMSTPVRQFLQESCEATHARAKYLKDIQSTKKDVGCYECAKPSADHGCDPGKGPPPKGSCDA